MTFDCETLYLFLVTVDGSNCCWNPPKSNVWRNYSNRNNFGNSGGRRWHRIQGCANRCDRSNATSSPNVRSYTIYALSAFKDFNTAEIEEVRLKFSIKLGGKAGIHYITEGSAESNLEIEVKCKFPEKQKPDSQ